MGNIPEGRGNWEYKAQEAGSLGPLSPPSAAYILEVIKIQSIIMCVL